MALTSKRRRNNNSLESFAKVLLSLSFLLIASVVLTPKDLRGYRQPGKRSRDSFDLLQLGSQQADFTNGDAVQDLELASVSSLNHRNYTFWSSDFHIGPIADLKDILSSSFGIRVIDKSLSAHCHLKNTCAKDLKVLNPQNGITLGDCPNKLRKEFYDAYVNDPEMQNVDAFLCNHACGMCELFMPFDKPLIIIASTRYEIGRHEPERWLEWNENLRRIAANPRNIVAANNVYDAEYIRYFTGIQDVPVIPSYCGYITEQYNPVRIEVLVGPSRGIHEGLFSELKEQGELAGTTFARIRDLYPQYTFSQLTHHPAIVLFPYQVSIMSIFEYYRMVLPVFVPSPGLLTQWHLQHRILRERTWDGTLFGTFGNASRLPCHPLSAGRYPYDPNNEIDEPAIRFWIGFADFYALPHVQTFESFADLIAKLKTVDLTGISRAMEAENTRLRTATESQWASLIKRAFKGTAAFTRPGPEQVNTSFEETMLSLYGIRLRRDACIGFENTVDVDAQ